MSRRRPAWRIQAIYNVADLAFHAGLKDSRGNPDTRRFVKTLKAEGCPIHTHGARAVNEVYLHDLRRCVPDLLEAIKQVAVERDEED